MMMGLSSERSLSVAITLALVMNAAWVLLIPSFPTMDGWTHLYNARMLLAGAPEGIYCTNPGLVPNIMGHILLGALDLVLPALVAERVMCALLVLLVGLGAYALSRSFGGGSLLILLVLPFTVSFLLVLGFHNFLLGLGLALFLAAWWVSRSRTTWGSFAMLLAGTVVLFYTHTAALILFCLLAGMHEVTVLLGLQERAGPWGASRWRGALLFILTCIPTVAMLVHFNLSQESVWSSIERGQLLRELLDLRSLLILDHAQEVKFTYAMKLVLIAGGLVALLAPRSGRPRWKPVHADIPLLVAVVLLGLYFVLPDSSGYAGFISVRLQLMGLIMAIVWMSTRPVPWVAQIVPVVLVLLLHTARNNHLSSALAPFEAPRNLTLDAARKVPPGSVVLPFSREEFWLLGHIRSLLAAERDLIVLDNYEAVQNYFPLVLCPDMPEYLRDHMTGREKCLKWLEGHLRSGAEPAIDHIVIVGNGRNPGSCSALELKRILPAYFRPIYTNGYAMVYERR